MENMANSSDRFRRSNVQAQISDLLGMVRGKNTDLYSYEEVARRVKAYQQIEAGTRMIPLNQIVGSVGRYRDFNKEFLAFVQSGKKAGQTPAQIAAAWKIPAKYKGYTDPNAAGATDAQRQRLQTNVESIYAALK